MTKTPAPHRPARADALRNEERLVAVAREMFTERGTDAPLEDIARMAGVGIGTLYRHFPTRQVLIEAVMRDHVQMVSALAEDLAGESDAEAALKTWLHSIVTTITQYQGSAKSMAIAMKCSGGGEAMCASMRDAGAMLLQRAQASGGIRSDVDIDDVLSMMNALAWMAEQGETDRVDRLLSVVLQGLRASP